MCCGPSSALMALAGSPQPPCPLTLKSSQHHITVSSLWTLGTRLPSGPRVLSAKSVGLDRALDELQDPPWTCPQPPGAAQLWVSTPTPLSSQRSFGNHKWLSLFSLQMSAASWGAGGLPGEPRVQFPFPDSGTLSPSPQWGQRYRPGVQVTRGPNIWAASCLPCPALSTRP